MNATTKRPADSLSGSSKKSFSGEELIEEISSESDEEGYT
jgi:hypothetical protein